MEMFQGLFESQEKIEELINALVGLSSVNKVVSEDKISYIQRLAFAYGIDPKTINFNSFLLMKQISDEQIRRPI